MSYTYKQLKNNLTNELDTKIILRKEDNTFIPFDDGNTDYQDYLAWLAEGNTPEAADQTVYKLTTRT